MEDEPQLILPDEGWLIPPEELTKLAKALAASWRWERRTRPHRPDPDGWVAQHRYA
jgi:hypothetical protein